MYNISVPVENANLNPENRIKTLKELKKIGAKRIFINVCYYFSDDKRKKVFYSLKDNVKFFKENGFEVGSWMPSTVVNGSDDFQYKQDVNGKEYRPWICPADARLIKIAKIYAEEIAKTGVDLIMYDDDFHYSYYDLGSNGLRGCACGCHKMLMKKMYPDIDFEEVIKKASEDEYNKYREIWENVNAEALKNYAREVRASVDSINPNIRMGFATNYTNWGIEGVNAEELSKILAGKTKPFLRFIGAPYWYIDSYGGSRDLRTVIDVVRYQSARTKNSGIETMAEGDVFPRPRTTVPSSVLELFDTALRADGNTNGILKYVSDYYSDADYETGYVDAHIENEQKYNEISKNFDNKISTGIKVYVSDKVFRQTNLKYKLKDNYNANEYKTSFFFHQAGRFLSLLSIPTTYDGEAISTAIFGENARFVEDEVLNNGCILDIGGALALHERGIDVGLKEFCGEFKVGAELFNEHIMHRMMKSNGYFKIIPKDNAKVLSYYLNRTPQYYGDLDGIEKTPAAYLYENANGQRFCVFAFAGHLIESNLVNEGEICFYAKTEQVVTASEWVCKKSLPAKCYKNPGLYMLCKKDGKSLSVGLWNIFHDKINKPEVILDKQYKSVEGIGCSVELKGNKAILSTINSFDFCAFIVSED